MPTNTQLATDDFYTALQGQWESGLDSTLGPLVAPNGNGTSPVHRWFPMKEAYSLDLLSRICDELGLERGSISILDPYCGCGTTAVSAASLADSEAWTSVSFRGVETNPFLHLVARSKLRALQSPPLDFEALAQRVAARALKGEHRAAQPALSTLSRSDYLSVSFLDELLNVKGAIDYEARAGASHLATDLARVCLAAAMEPATRLRKDGRALRFETTKVPVRPLNTFLRRAEDIVEDLPRPPSRVEGDVELADTRRGLDAVGKYDLVVFSPPYPNNIDYTEVYKLELWLLGYVRTTADFAEQRRRTIRSHASLRFEDPPDLHPAVADTDIEDLASPIIAAIPEGNRYASGRRRIVRQYLTDMLSSFLHLERAMKPGGSLVYVVGNSLHGSSSSGSLLIASDLLLASLAERAGLVVDRLAIARSPSRRASASPYLRESVVFTHKPNA